MVGTLAALVLTSNSIEAILVFYSLTSDEAGWITGQRILVNGGATI